MGRPQGRWQPLGPFAELAKLKVGALASPIPFARSFLSEPLWREFMGPPRRAQGAYGSLRHDMLDRAGEPLQGSFAYMMGMGGQLLCMMPQQDLVSPAGRGCSPFHTTLYAAWKAIAIRRLDSGRLGGRRAEFLCLTVAAVCSPALRHG